MQRWREQYGAWAVVTGASDGIGRAVADELARAGVNLVLVARRQSVLEEIAQDYAQRTGIATRVVAADLAHAAGVAAVIEATATLEVGLLVAAAGFGTAGSFLDLPLAREEEMLAVNCRSVLALTHHFGQRFAAQRRGGIVLFSSLVAFQGVPLAAHYGATKAYIQSLAEGLHHELAPWGVHVLACAPGPVQSGFAQAADMRMGLALTPQTVARDTLAALGRQANVRPGWLSKALIGGLHTLPRRGRVRALAGIMRDMTKHQARAARPGEAA